MQIDHDPNERRGDGMWWLWWAAWGIVAILWAGAFYFETADWPSVSLGAFTGLILMAWAVDVTGNKVTGSTGSNEGRRRRQDW